MPSDLEPGDPVITTDLTGETDVAVVTSISDHSADTYQLPIENSLTVYEYWGHRLDPDESVAHVRFAEISDDGEYIPYGNRYAWPVSYLDPVGTGGEDGAE